ncbi:MAG: hypothetical protein N3B01_07320, partial [Verrucomicrobiae bacterium]|nr:hypothetical protein [Verrucomicrobiae bacterium]
MNGSVSRRQFLAAAGWMAGGLLTMHNRRAARAAVRTPHPDMAVLRRTVMDSPVIVARHRAQVFTEVFQQHESKPWILRKALALRRYFETVPLYLREHDRIAGSISETPGAMPLMVELGIAENNIYTSERPDRVGYLKGQVPEEILHYWANRNMWGLFRTKILGQPPVKSHADLKQNAGYKFISNQGHLCPSYAELLRVGIGGLQKKVAARQNGETDPDKLAFLQAAEHALAGLSTWALRYSEFLGRHGQREMGRICARIATEPPETFREALQLIWLAHQAIHIEGHGYSCTPDRLDQLLFPFYEADRKAGRLDDDEVVRLVENLVLKMFDNTFWGPEHHLTQGFVVGGSAPDGRDRTNRLSWLMLEAATNMALPEPLIWLRWHPNIDQKFFDFGLSRLTHTTCFPMFWNDKVVVECLIALGVSREDAFNYAPVGCNELAIPGQCYYNPCAHVNYLQAIEAALTGGRGYDNQWKWKDVAPPARELGTFEQFVAAVGAYMRRQIEHSYTNEMKVLEAQMRWGVTPLTSCFFHGCIERAQDMARGTKYNILSCGGIGFANAVDCLAAIREVVYRKKQATLEEVAAACAENFKGYERLRARLLAAPKHGNDLPELNDLIAIVERLRDEPVKAICRDPRDGTPFGNSHVVRSSAVTQGRVTPATPDGRLAGTPLASSVAASVGCERSGPTAVLNSVCRLNPVKSWQCAYQVNIRFHAGLIADQRQREKLRAMLNVYFQNGGQQLQINVVDSATLRAAQKNPEQF